MHLKQENPSGCNLSGSFGVISFSIPCVATKMFEVFLKVLYNIKGWNGGWLGWQSDTYKLKVEAMFIVEHRLALTLEQLQNISLTKTYQTMLWVT